MKAFVDEFSVVGQNVKHIFHQRLCVQRCRDTSLQLNLVKCAFVVRSKVLFGHIISKEGPTIDPKKVKAISQLPPLEDLKQLERFVGKVK